MNVQNLLKVNNKYTRTKSLTYFWCFTVNSKHIFHLALVFLVFLLLTLNKYSLGQVAQATVSKNGDITLLLFLRTFYLLQSEANSETVTYLKWCFFTKIVYSLKSSAIWTISSVLRSVTGCLICLGYFFRFTFIIDLFFSPNIFKY